MDILKQSENIKFMERFCEIQQSGTGNSRIVMFTKINNCVCCGAIVGLIKLNNCSHKQFLECFFKDRMDFAMAVVCHHCHGMLKRIDDFRKRIECYITQRQPPFNSKPALTTLSKPIVNSIQPINTGHRDVIVVQKQLVIPEAVESHEIKEIKEEVEECMAHSNMSLVIKEEDTDYIADSDMGLKVKVEGQDDTTDCNMGLDRTMIPPMFASTNNRPAEHLIVEVPKMIELPVEVKPENKLVQNPPPTTDPSTIRRKSSSRPANELHGKVQMVMLTKEELEKEREETRRSDKYRLSEIRCEDCLLSFVHPYNLAAHMKKHDTSNGGFVCEVCKSVWKNEATLQIHRICHWRRYQCVPCGMRFKGSPMVCVSHYNKAHGADGRTIDRVFQCTKEDCDFTSNDFLALKKHRNIHKTKVSCDECGKLFSCKTSLKNHKINFHSSHARIYKCKDCHKEFRTHGGLTSHWKGMHAPVDKSLPLHFCTICGRHYKTYQILAAHLRNHSKHVGDDGRKFICDYCGEKFLLKNSVKDHIEVKHLKSQYKCSYCDKVCHLERSLKKHVQTKHTAQEPKEKILCDLCGKGFKSAHILKSHMRTHTGERPFECPYCSATFGFSAALYTHKRLKHKHPKVRQ